MSKYYNPQRARNLYDPKSKEPFRISRSKIELFLNCPRCFYLDRRLGISQPPGYPFSLNSAVDNLLKTEFDSFRREGKAHPFMVEAGIDAIPMKHEKLNEWRDALRGGVVFLHSSTNLLITGGIDDVWVNPKGELIVVDYKATSKNEEVTIDADWQMSYKRQMEIYQWLFLQNGFKVNSTGYFVYCNGISDAAVFNKRIDFDVKLIPYKGDSSWVEQTIIDMHRRLNNSKLPEAGSDCDFCKYRETVREQGH